MILKVARIGNPVLRQAAKDLTPAEITSTEMQRLIDDMVETMREYNGVGLAAPQVHQSVRLLVIEAKSNPRYPGSPEIPLTVFFNLKIEPVGKEKDTDWEGCLSVPGMRGLVPRYRKIKGTALNRDGQPFAFEAEGFTARVIQHEGDHLDGKVYLDRMEDMRSLSFLEEFQKYVAGVVVAEE